MVFNEGSRKVNDSLSRYMDRVEASRPKAHVGKVVEYTHNEELSVNIIDIPGENITIKFSEGLLLVQPGHSFEVDDIVMLVSVTSRYMVFKLARNIGELLERKWIEIGDSNPITINVSSGSRIYTTGILLTELNYHEEILVEGIYGRNRFSFPFRYDNLDSLNESSSGSSYLNVTNRVISLGSLAVGKSATHLLIGGSSVGSIQFTVFIKNRLVI